MVTNCKVYYRQRLNKDVDILLLGVSHICPVPDLKSMTSVRFGPSAANEQYMLRAPEMLKPVGEWGNKGRGHRIERGHRVA